MMFALALYVAPMLRLHRAPLGRLFVAAHRSDLVHRSKNSVVIAAVLFLQLLFEKLRHLASYT